MHSIPDRGLGEKAPSFRPGGAGVHSRDRRSKRLLKNG